MNTPAFLNLVSYYQDLEAEVDRGWKQKEIQTQFPAQLPGLPDVTGHVRAHSTFTPPKKCIFCIYFFLRLFSFN